jgi:hypothetical protein
LKGKKGGEVKKGSKGSEDAARAARKEAVEAAMMEETSRMLANEEEFVIGEAAEEKPFMREEPVNTAGKE